DGIRDRNVTGVQTCALPISHVVVEQAPGADRAGDETAAARVLGEHVPLLVSATRPDTLAGQASALADLFERRPELSPAEVAAGTDRKSVASGKSGARGGERA